MVNLLRFMGRKISGEKLDNEQIGIVQMTNVCKTDFCVIYCSFQYHSHRLLSNIQKFGDISNRIRNDKNLILFR